MADVTIRDERGAVYVEFLFAFLPLFVLFLALCQIALLVAGKLVVRHAAFSAARSAIVVLDDDPAYYDDAPRGVLSEGKVDALASLATSLAPDSGPETGSPAAQRGARMQAIRSAALRPLSVIAPTGPAFFGGQSTTLAKSIAREPEGIKAFARVYSEAAAVVTVHAEPGRDELALEPILHETPVVVRVTYLQLCGVPLVRNLACRSLGALLDQPVTGKTSSGAAGSKRPTLRERLGHAGMPGWLEAAADPSARFMVFDAEMTLPNQGALYEYSEAGDAPALGL